jgi:hypothetical protein
MCELCGSDFEAKNNKQRFCNRACFLEYQKRKQRRKNRKKKTMRFSGEIYINSEEKLNAIKEKYKNGITKDILKEFAESLKINAKKSIDEKLTIV